MFEPLLHRPTKMDLKVALNESFTALNLFLNNKFLEALDLLRPWYTIQVELRSRSFGCSILIPFQFLCKHDLKQWYVSHLDIIIPTHRRNDSMYHAMGYSSILSMQAGMTFEPKDMEMAVTALQEALVTCQRYSQFLTVVTITSFCIFPYHHFYTWPPYFHNLVP